MYRVVTIKKTGQRVDSEQMFGSYRNALFYAITIVESMIRTRTAAADGTCVDVWADVRAVVCARVTFDIATLTAAPQADREAALDRRQAACLPA